MEVNQHVHCIYEVFVEITQKQLLSWWYYHEVGLKGTLNIILNFLGLIGQTLLVSERCLVSIQMDDYVDEIFLDVQPMNFLKMGKVSCCHS